MSVENTMTQNEYEADYIRGFEAGYDLSMWEPDIARVLEQIKADTPYIEGVRNGNAEFEKEQKDKEMLPDFLQSDRLKTKLNNEEKNLEQDKDKGKELEI
ncbi:MAG: hypothetical protein J0L47_11200 [Flavobacteriales bacterium]|jgi:hypothetical protein|nr:hypothetical protein [Flavobacteriales bacterium]MCA0392353.1 hypothetical protein [Bacteroidota bacterium]